MKKSFKEIQIEKLDEHLDSINICHRPTKGWINAIRRSIGMTVEQLANRIGVSQQAISQVEKNEISDSLTLKSIRRAAEAMNCKFVYAVVPEEKSLRKLVKSQALKKAKETVQAVDQSMLLEAQSVGDREEKIEELANELANNPNSKLWE